MFTLHIDLGQVVLSIIAAAMGVMVYFVKRTVEGFGDRIDRHDRILFNLNGNVRQIMGKLGMPLQRDDE